MNKEDMDKLLDLLYDLEDKEGYLNNEVGKCVNYIQKKYLNDIINNMQTLQEVKLDFANNSNYLIPGQYLIDLNDANPDGEDENILWEAGYIRGYEVCLKGILNDIQNSSTLSADSIEKYINNLLTD